jgi:diguanylate cyclase (GGDEF)-like protein
MTAEPGPSRRPRRISLQAKLLGVVLLCVVVPVLSMGAYLLRRNEEVLREKMSETLTNHLLRRDASLEAWFDERLREAARWSASFVVYEAMAGLERPGGERERENLDAYLGSLLGHYPVYESLFIVNPQGVVVASTREEQLEDWARPLAAEAGAAQATVSPLRRSEILGRPTLLILHPIQPASGEARGRVLGFFVQRVDLQELESMLGESASDLTRPLWLLDGEGRILAREGRVLQEPGLEPFPGPVTVSPDDGPVREATLPGLGDTVYGVRDMTGRFHGKLAATVPAGVAYRSLQVSRTRLIVVGGIAISIIALLNFLAARSILRPILLLSQGAKRVAAGDLDVYLPVRGRDEIADLTRAFNDMAGKIREGRSSLETARDELERTNAGLKAANRALETLAITDGLTSLYNHRHFQDTLDAEIRRCEQQGRTLSLLLIDIDHFKQYNDRWGHQEGDAALRRVAAQLMKGIRATDKAFRYGGEELAVLLPSCPRPQAAEVADKLRLAVRNHAHRPGRFGDRLTVSIGVAAFPEDARVSRGLVDMADAALYAAKAGGRDRVVVAGPAAPEVGSVG